MKNIVLILISAFFLWSCNADNVPNQEFSLQGKFIENCETGKPLSGAKFNLVCRHSPSNKARADIVIPFTTKADGSFFVKGEPNLPYYFVTDSYNQISSGKPIIDAMGAKHYDVGTVYSEFKDNQYYPVVLKYDLTQSTFGTGDTIVFNTFKTRILNPIRTSLGQFSKNDTVYFSGENIGRIIPTNNDFVKIQDLDLTISKNPNFWIELKNRKADGRNLVFSATHLLHYRCDRYPVVTVKIP